MFLSCSSLLRSVLFLGTLLPEINAQMAECEHSSYSLPLFGPGLSTKYFTYVLGQFNGPAKRYRRTSTQFCHNTRLKREATLSDFIHQDLTLKRGVGEPVIEQ